jgi:hypothetical protein
LLVAVPVVGTTIGVVNIETDSRIIEIIVPAERIISTVADAVIWRVAIAIVVGAIAITAPIIAAVTIGTVEVVGATAER